MKEKIRKWYEGEFIVHENDHSSGLVFTGGNYKRHWTAKLARVVADFWLLHWKWVFATVFAVVGLILAFKKL
jgi:hypothetical protein